MAISPAEEQFNKQVEKAPIVQSLKEGQELIQNTLNEEIKSNDKRFGQLEDKVDSVEEKVDSLEEKVDNGFERIGAKIDNLASIVTNNKEESLKAQLKKTEEALEKQTKKEEERESRKTSNKDKIKNTSLGGLIIIVLDFFTTNIISSAFVG